MEQKRIPFAVKKNEQHEKIMNQNIITISKENPLFTELSKKYLPPKTKYTDPMAVYNGIER